MLGQNPLFDIFPHADIKRFEEILNSKLCKGMGMEFVLHCYGLWSWEARGRYKKEVKALEEYYKK